MRVTPSSPFRWLLAKVLLVCATLVAVVGCDIDDLSKIVLIENQHAGTDPHGFITARDMYVQPAVVNLDDMGRRQLTKLTDLVRRNPRVQHSTQSDGWWLGLAYLNRCRTSREVQDAVAKWAELCAADIRSSSGEIEHSLFLEANKLYHGREFGAASQTYVQVLSKYPAHLDARNNFGLAQLHKGNDLIAVLQWEILRRLSPSYVPARINLTVAYERLGRRDLAKAMAQEAFSLQSENPKTTFNMAWMKDLEGDHRAAEDLLEPLAGLLNAGKISGFHDLVSRQ